MNTTSTATQRGPGFTLGVVAVATLITFGLSFIPFAAILTYPIQLFSTFIHEAGHVLAALLTFGSVKDMTVALDTSGLTHTAGGWRFAISSAGYLGTALFGALMLVSARSERAARWAMGLTGGLVLAITGFFAGEGSTIPVWLGLGVAAAAIAGFVAAKDKHLVRIGLGAVTGLALAGVTLWLLVTNGLLTWVLGLSCGLGLLAAAWKSRDWLARALVAFLGVQVSLNALDDVVGLVGLSQIPSVHTDAVNMANTYGLHPIIWALLWSGVAFVLMGAAITFLVIDWRRQSKVAVVTA